MSGDSPFGPAAVSSAVHATLDAAYAAIPDGRTHAVIFDGTIDRNGAGVRALFVQRAPEGWNVVLEGDYSGAHGAAGSVVVAKSW